MAEQPGFYVAAAACGCVKMACLDNPEHRREIAREIASCIRGGLEVRHVNSVPGWPWECAEHQAAKAAKRAKARKRRGEPTP